jgi:hypothetical protein
MKKVFRLLTFRLRNEEANQFSNTDLAIGIAGAWLAGMGRYWDHSNAGLLQYAGVGSVIYIFILALFIWLLVLPYRVPGWRYKKVLTFISLTSFPAIIYAIPVEQMMSLEKAATTNAWFLLVVAAWRVVLLYLFLKRIPALRIYASVLTFFPLALIVSSLSLLNLEKVVFNIMGGIRDTNAAHAAYEILLLLTMISVVCLLPFLLFYILGIIQRRNILRQQK